MEFKLKGFNRNITDQELLDDIKRVADNLGTSKISSRTYDNNGAKYTSGTINIRFGGWNNALKKAGIELVQDRGVSQKELFENLEKVWIKLGKQPVFRSIDSSISKYSTHQYLAKFGSWIQALEAFVEWVNSDVEQNQEIIEVETNAIEINIEKPVFRHKTKRLPSERLKVQVLMRDGNKCRLCGITLTGENIHFDHILAWSKGGETELDNLQILCAPHNLAKGNLEYQ